MEEKLWEMFMFKRGERYININLILHLLMVKVNAKRNAMRDSYWPAKEVATAVSLNPICKKNKIQCKGYKYCYHFRPNRNTYNSTYII